MVAVYFSWLFEVNYWANIIRSASKKDSRGFIIMQYWKIVAGHREKDPDEVKSVILGDWLRKNYISIGWEEDTPQGKAFREEMQIADGVVVVSDGFVWALGIIESEAQTVTLDKGSLLYPCQRKVTWLKVTKMAYKAFPKRLYNKLKTPKALVRLHAEDWEILKACLP
ncbi:MAG: hypothetical protein RMJ15_02465 [Nitrososphaerota archaeon]|nr:hypothetical protein [Nitrososphaerota archaeon]